MGALTRVFTGSDGNKGTGMGQENLPESIQSMSELLVKPSQQDLFVGVTWVLTLRVRACKGYVST